MATLFIGPTRLGDAVLASGVLNWLSETYPGDPITVACGGPAAMVLRDAPGIEALHVMEKRRRGGHWLDLWRMVRGRRWRRVVDLRRSLLPWLVRTDARFRVPTGRPGEHRVALAARMLGLPPVAPRVWLSDGHRAIADRMLPHDAPILALGVGANWICKTWPAERFAELGRALLGPGGKLSGGCLLLVGGDAERISAATVIEALPPARIIDAMGLDIATTGALLERASLFVGNDSAMMHLAAAVGARTVGLFGPTRDDHYGPWGANGLVVRTPASVEQLLAALRQGGAKQTLMGGLTTDAVVDCIERHWPRLGHPAPAKIRADAANL